MGKKCEMEAPGPEDRDKWSLTQVAELLGYQESSGAATIRRLVLEGRLPRPRGFGEAQFYSPLDVAIILEMAGRWGPQEQARTSENAQKRARTRENDEESES